MPAQKNPVVRVIVTVVVILAAVAVVASVFVASGKQRGGASQQAPAMPTTATPAAPGSDVAGSQTPSPTGEQAGVPASDGSATGPEQPGVPVESTAAARGTLRARAFDPDAPSPTPLGSIDPATGYRSQVVFTTLGAGIESITATDFFASLRDKFGFIREQRSGSTSGGTFEHYEIQTRGRVQNPDGSFYSVVSLAALAVSIDGQFVDLFSRVTGGQVLPLWRETAPGVFEAEIIDENDQVVARVERRYELPTDSFTMHVRQTVTNLTSSPMSVEWVQFGPVDLTEDKTGYALDVRRIRFGHLLEPQATPAPGSVAVDRRLIGRLATLDRISDWYARNRGLADPPPMWPDADRFKRASDLTWVAQTSRYFAFAVMPYVPDPSAPVVNRVLPFGARVDAVVLGIKQRNDDPRRLALQLRSAPVPVEPGGAADMSFSAYAGPLARTYLSASANPSFGELGLNRLVVYNLGGMCAWCTFQWLAVPMVRFLGLLHDYVVFDWAIAIMLLVVVVRTILHPVTKKSQIGLARFGKQMQRLAPKQKALQEKYKGDPKKLQQEVARLMREENVSYRGMLGCLPMFLQTPIWIAVYAVIYFTFELRHEAGLFGVFQHMTGWKWTFLGDLSAPDHFIEFGRSFHIPLISGMMGSISGINVLPLVLGVVFYIQQKYLTPPSATPLSPEQEQMQKMTKIMMVVMFPLFMYNAPSGLTIYFLTNSTLGILESRWVRAHINQLDLDTPQPKPTGGRKKVQNTARAAFQKERERKRFKER